MTLPVHLLEDPRAVGELLANEICDGIARAGADGQRYLLGCPGGRSPLPTYRALAQRVAERRLDLRPLVLVLMDEYLLEDDHGRHRLADPAAHYSCVGFAERELLGPLAAAAPTGSQPRPDALWVPSVEPRVYDERIANAGGVDLFLLASGSSDGHVAFNPPGTPREAGTGLVELADSTRRDNLRTFPDFASIDAVPRLGVSVGPDTIARHSRRATMICTGAEKRDTVARLRAATAYDPSWPATIVHDCADARLLVDAAAASDAPVPGVTG